MTADGSQWLPVRQVRRVPLMIEGAIGGKTHRLLHSYVSLPTDIADGARVGFDLPIGDGDGVRFHVEAEELHDAEMLTLVIGPRGLREVQVVSAGRQDSLGAQAPNVTVNVDVEPTPVTVENTVNVDPTPVNVNIADDGPDNAQVTFKRDPKTNLIQSAKIEEAA